MGTNIILVDSEAFVTFDPEEAEFIIAHELSHLQQRHNISFGLACLIFPFLAHACLRLWDTGIQKVTAGTNNIFVQKATGANSWISNFCFTKAFLAASFSFLLSQHHEKQADLLALQKTNCHQGGYKFLEHVRQINLTAREQQPDLAPLISDEGDTRLDYNHPSINKRIAYMQADEQARGMAQKQLS